MQESPSIGKAGWLTLIICGICALVGRLAYLRHPWDGDAAILVYSGKAIAQGARFGYDICDNKFPTAALWNAMWWRALGSFWPGYVLAGLFMVAIAIAILTGIARKYAGRDAVLPTLLFALVYVNFCPALFGGFQLETTLTLTAAAAAVFAMSALITGRCLPAFICGLISGCAVYLKPTGLSVAATFVGIQFLQSLNWIKSPDGFTFRRMIWQWTALLAGLLIPIAMAVIYLWAADTLQDMPRLYRQISDYAQNSVWDVYTTLKILLAAIALAVPMWVRRRLGFRNSMSVLATFAAAWLTIEFLGVIAQRRMYGYHFLVLAAPAALLFGQIPAKPRWSTLLLPLAPAIFFSMWACSWQLFGRPDSPRLAVSDYLLQHARPSDTVWMDNMPRLLMETGLRPASRHLITLPFYNTDASPMQMGSELLSDLAKHPPTYIIIPTDARAMLTKQCQFMAELADRPQRRQNYCAVWNTLFDFIDKNYQPASALGDRTIYTHRAPELATLNP